MSEFQHCGKLLKLRWKVPIDDMADDQAVLYCSVCDYWYSPSTGRELDRFYENGGQRVDH